MKEGNAQQTKYVCQLPVQKFKIVKEAEEGKFAQILFQKLNTTFVINDWFHELKYAKIFFLFSFLSTLMNYDWYKDKLPQLLLFLNFFLLKKAALINFLCSDLK